MLGHRFAEGKNSLNAIRLVLAAMVIVSHSWWLGGYGPEPQPGGVKLGTWAVIGFFGISGYLITQSRVQARTTWSHARARFLRIYGPLWTLFWEIVCYVLVGVVFGFFRPELARLALLSLFVLGSAVVLAVDAGWVASPTPYDWPLVPVLTFLAGSLAYLFRDRIPASRVALGVCAVLVVVIAGLGFAPSLVHAPLCIQLLAGSLQLPLSAVGSRYDISYGVYIYGWPVQQVLASFGVHDAVPPLIFGGAALLIVAPLAWLSCRCVEGPARRWRRAKDAPRRVPELA